VVRLPSMRSILKAAGLVPAWPLGIREPADQMIYDSVSWLAPGIYGAPLLERLDKLAARYGSVVWVYVGVWRIANDIASLPVRLYRVGPDGDEKSLTPVLKHPVLDLLRGVNKEEYPYAFWEQYFAYLELEGTNYTALVPNRAGTPVEMFYLEPQYVRIVPGTDALIKEYIYQPAHSGRIFSLDAEQVIRARYFNPLSRLYGQGSLTAAGQSILAEEQAASYQVQLFKNRGRMDGVLTTEQTLNKQSAEVIQMLWRKGQRMLTENFGTIILGSGMKWAPIQMNPKDSEYLNSRKLSREDILACIGVPPAVAGLESGDVGRRREQFSHYWRSTLLPKINHRDGVLTEFLLPKFPGTDEMILKTDLSDVMALQEDIQITAQATTSLVGSGQMTINETRRKFYSLPPVSWGDTWWAPISLAPPGEAAPGFAQGAAGAAGGGPGEGANPQRAFPLYERPALPLFRSNGDMVTWKDALWADYIGKTFDPAERAFLRATQRAIAEVTRQIVGRLKRHPAGDRLTSAVADRAIPHPREMAVLFARMAQAPLRQALQAGADSGREAIAHRRSFTAVVRKDEPLPELPGVLTYLAERPPVYGLQVSQTFYDVFRRYMDQAVQAGGTIQEMTDQIEQEVYPRLARYEAQRIARTEVNSAVSLSRHAVFQSANVEKHSWLSARIYDGPHRVRDEHQQAEEDYGPDTGGIPMDQPFVVAGVEMMQPGDPAVAESNPELVINCRCLELPEFPELQGEEG
jgi:HK97 family phage portal protein